MSWDHELSDEQRRIASHDGEIVRLVAGPGTGKTRVMTRRIAYLIEDAGVNPTAILALTFSRAAARELRERLEGLLDDADGDRPSVYTLHAFALRQLLRAGGAPGLPHPIQIADDYDERWVIKAEIARLTETGVKDVDKELRNLASDWETLAVDQDEWERNFPNGQFLAAWRQHREVYGYTLRAELVYALKKALDEDPDMEMEPEFTHVLVDEYQDLNRCEIAVLKRLTASRRLFVAGDDDQSIYGFRNAYPLGLREFPETYAESAQEELAECHRCDCDILSIGLQVAEQDIDRIPKALGPLPEAADGHVEALSFRDTDHEAEGIAGICRRLVEDQDVEPHRILILLRNDPDGIYSTPIIEALAEQGLDAELPENPFSILDRDDGRRFVCLIRLLRDPEDGLAWRELLKLRDNRIGDGTLLAFYRFAAESRDRYHAALQALTENPDEFENRMRWRLAEEVGEINDLLDEHHGLLNDEAEPALERALDAVDFPAGDERDALVDLLLELVVDDVEATLGDIEEALHSVRGSWDQDERDGEEDKIQIMSMHTAKGLTADAVIVAACENELIPGWPEDQHGYDDERRLLYVSLTRARNFLFVTFARRRYGQQSHRLQSPDRNRTQRTYTRFLVDYLPPTEG
jgi:DNA helicase-2/ATP-dependent DNA helicase PcrA